MMALSPLALLLPLVLFSPSIASAHSTRGGSLSNSNHENMNGNYVLSSTPNGRDTNRLFPTQYKNYPDKSTTSFDVYSPLVSQLYSQVFWKGLPPVKLPQNIIDRFQGKVMAVVGFELDQVMQDEDGQEFSIPFNALYNHHFESVMIGANAQFELTSPEDERLRDAKTTMGHGIPPHQPYWLVTDAETTTDQAAPNHQSFGGANGGEVRQSFHGYAPGFAQLIDSPHSFQITPMQIDTYHRDQMDLKNSTHFVAGPLPRNSLAPPNATYSGLLECPVSTRIVKHLPPQGFFPLSKGMCQDQAKITTAQDCYTAVAQEIRQTDKASVIHNATGTAHHRPAGCSVHAIRLGNAATGQPRVLEAYFNTNDKADMDCSSSHTQVFSAQATTSLVQTSVVVDTSQNLVTITLQGPADVWFGVGFGAHKMADQPWTIVVEGGEKGAITERKLANHAAGTIITPQTITVKANVTKGDTRTVTLTRPIQGPHYSFDPFTTKTELPFINAIGSSAAFSYHQNKETTSMMIVPAPTTTTTTSSGGGMCLCQQDPPPFGKDRGGTLEYHPVEDQAGERGTKGSVACQNWCVHAPRMDLLDQENPTCDVRTYSGGQIACHHMWSLLDADQDIPWPDQPLEYRLKFRFWVQDYDADYHTNVKRTTWGIGSPVEYDVPKCAKGMAGCSRETINPETGEERWVHTIRGKFSKHETNSGKLVAAHFHCHAPTCLRTALYSCSDEIADHQCDETTGTLLCEETAVSGHGRQDGQQRFNEPGFIYQPPCLWGSSEVGLEAPVDVRNQTLFAIKTADATHGHHGEMAWLQMYYV